MSIRWLKNVIDDKDYYIGKCCDKSSLLKINADIEQARNELKELERMIAERYVMIDRIIEYKEVILQRNKPYRGNVELVVYIRVFKTIDGQRLDKTEMVYGTHKRFKGNERKQAKAYADELSKANHCKIILENF